MISYGKHHIDEADIEAVVDVLRHGPLTQGPLVEQFESAVAEYVGAKYAVAVANGTAALHIACIAAGLEPGKQAITSPNSFCASANCVKMCGADIDFVDIDSETLNISTQLLADKCQQLSRVDAIIPVHFAGNPCDMVAIQKIAREKQAIIIEDAAHALGAVYPDGSRVGNCKYSDMTMFSFHPVKLISAGEGGMITTNDRELYKKLLRLRSHGINKLDDSYRYQNKAYENQQFNPWYYEMQELGFNYRITDIQCALALSQMKKIEQFLEKRRQLAGYYDIAFEQVPNVKLTQLNKRAESAHHLYVLRIPYEKLGTTRNQFMAALRKQSIGTQVHYIPIHMHPYYRENGTADLVLPQAEAYYAEALSIPLFYDLSDDQQQGVIAAIKELTG